MKFSSTALAAALALGQPVVQARRRGESSPHTRGRRLGKGSSFECGKGDFQATFLASCTDTLVVTDDVEIKGDVEFCDTTDLLTVEASDNDIEIDCEGNAFYRTVDPVATPFGS